MPAARPLSCRICGDTDIENMVKDRTRRTGYRHICRECFASGMKSWKRTPSGQRYLGNEFKKRQDEFAADPDKVRNARRASYHRHYHRQPDRMHEAFGKAVRAWRLANNISQITLSKALGIAQSHLSMKERGITRWTPDEMAKLQRAGVEFWNESEAGIA